MKWHVNCQEKSQRSVLSEFACFLSIRIGSPPNMPKFVRGGRYHLDRAHRAGTAAPGDREPHSRRHGHTAGEFVR
ncbi:hypothetical protein GCM10010495_25830 [Kitasatospora herbaricolor]|nr:hypothetical protein [Kitasatospora herbaricolor]GGV11304.1 hypothetical protein GCM10010495_25830 [Kitasatospora herbaricolor]